MLPKCTEVHNLLLDQAPYAPLADALSCRSLSLDLEWRIRVFLPIAFRPATPTHSFLILEAFQ